MGILLGLASAMSWGVADFLARYATKRIGTYSTLFIMQFIGLAALSIYLAVSGEFARLSGSTSWQPWAWALLVAVFNVCSSLALYRSFEVGVMAIVSPIAASSTALTVVLAFLSGETVSQARGIGIGATLLGVILAATHLSATKDVTLTELAAPRARKVTRGVGWALLASLGYGVTFWMIGFHVTPFLGGIAPVWLIRLTTICLLPLFAYPLRQRIYMPRGHVWGLLAAVGVLDTIAFLAAAIGFTTDQISVVSVLVSLFSVVTVILAWFFLREKLGWHQWLGIVIIFAGVVLVKI